MVSHRILLSFITVIIFSCSSSEGTADIIIVAPVYTMNEKQPWAEAVVLQDDKIIFVGDRSKALSHSNNSTRMIKRPGGMVLPGFIDSHVHLLWGGIEMSEC